MFFHFVRFTVILTLVHLTFANSNRFLFGNLKNRTYYEAKFFTWMSQHRISFHHPQEYVHRLNIFAKNDDFIQKHNQESHASYILGHNQFSHISWEEFRQFAKGYHGDKKKDQTNLLNYEWLNVPSSDIPESKDWVKDGAVSSIKNQGQCGSCWAFSAIGAVEGAAFVSSQKLFNLSEQELVDCDKKDMGCGGGLMDHAFKWIEKHGVCIDEDYPYHAKREKCKKCKSRVRVSSFYDIPYNNETALQAAVAQQPVSVAIEADQPAFQFYKSGVFNASCGTKLDHGVLVVGYGEINNKKYWKVKNSWGSTWGDAGYIYLSREMGSLEGQCGIAMAPSYAVAEVSEIVKDEMKHEFKKHSIQIKTEMKEKHEAKGQVSMKRTSSASISQCGDKSSALALFSELSVNPAKPSRGKPIYFSGKGILKGSLSDTNTTFSLEVNLGGAKVYSDVGKMCGDSVVNLPLGLGKIDIHGFQCPREKGPFKDIGVDVTLPEIAPPGKYEIHLISSHGKEQVFCVHVTMDLSLTMQPLLKDNNLTPIMLNSPFAFA